MTMNKLDHYLDAATRENTRRSYDSAVRHFEVEWQGFLPATADGIARYLADYAGKLAINTLKQRLAALAQWHLEQGFPDPTKAPVVRKVLKGIQTLHPAMEKQAVPLQIDQLEQATHWLEEAIRLAREQADTTTVLRHTRDKALLLMGFWRGFRGDELKRLQVEFIELTPGLCLHCFLPQSKGDRGLRGRTFKVPALARLCPVTAYTDWIELAGLTSGPVFRGVDRWGAIRADALHASSLIPLLRRLFVQAGLSAPNEFSSHSLRRGFAGWANANGWDIKTLMEYVGWKDVKSALRYIDSADPFAGISMVSTPTGAGATLASASPAGRRAPAPNPTMPLTLNLAMKLTPFSVGTRGLAKAHRSIEAICLQRHGMQRLNKDGTQYRLIMAEKDEDGLAGSIAALLDDMHRIAENQQCFLDASLHDPIGDRSWH